MSIMMGLETAVKGLQSYSTAIDTTAHNIANADTEGYSQQLADITASQPMTMIGSAGQVGTGSQIGAIERIRDLYLDTQIDLEQQNVGYWSIIDRTYQSLEAVFPEAAAGATTSVGLDQQLQAFWSDWQTLADNAQLAATTNPLADVEGAKRQVYNDADAIAQSLNTKSSALTDMQISLNSNLRDTVSQINQYTQQIYELNKEIATASNFNQRPNDLLDKRTLALANLSNLVNVNVGNRTDGTIVVTIQGHMLVNGADGYNQMTTVGGVKDSKLEDVALFEYMGASPVNITSSIQKGQLAGILQSRDQVIQWYKTQLDELANSLITVVNRIYRTGVNDLGVQSNLDFFLGNKASSIAVNTALNSGANITYKHFTNNDIAQILADLNNKLMNNWITTQSLPVTTTSASQLGMSGIMSINTVDTVFNSTDTIAQFINNLNNNVSDFSAVFDDTTHQFFIVSNQLMTVEEVDNNPARTPHLPPNSLLFKYNWIEEQRSAAPVNYSGSLVSNSVVATPATWDMQKNQLNTEASTYGTMNMTYNGKTYAVNWANNEAPALTAADMWQFGPTAPPPRLASFGFDKLTQKFYFGSNINSGAGANKIDPFTVADEQGNMTQVMNLTGNVRFGDFYDMITGNLKGQVETGDTTLSEYQAALAQYQGMQDNITKVNVDQEQIQAAEYQRAYDATVKVSEVIDEMLDMLINKTATEVNTFTT
jgi:flagellar hook-associated protein 1 FlgK